MQACRATNLTIRLDVRWEHGQLNARNSAKRKLRKRVEQHTWTMRLDACWEHGVLLTCTFACDPKRRKTYLQKVWSWMKHTSVARREWQNQDGYRQVQIKRKLFQKRRRRWTRKQFQSWHLKDTRCYQHETKRTKGPPNVIPKQVYPGCVSSIRKGTPQNSKGKFRYFVLEPTFDHNANNIHQRCWAVMENDANRELDIVDV